VTHTHTHPPDTTGHLKTAFFLNFGFTILEIAGGLWTNSTAIIADAVHDLGDSLSLGLAWFLNRYAQKGPTHRYSYGYRRYSLLGALINTIILIVGGIIVLFQAVPRLLDPETTHAPGMIGLAVVGILVNGLAAFRLRGDKSANVKVAGWHLLEDLLGWIAVLIVSVILLFTDLYILDPILSILITLYVMVNMIRSLKQTFGLFLQAVPSEVDIREIEAKLQAIDGVHSTHHTHIWSLDGEQHVLTTHLVVDKEAAKEDILQIKKKVTDLAEAQDFEHVTIEIEYAGEAHDPRYHEEPS
jgi:cobalt-zinc-cadmium efflux system protein